MPQLCGDYQTGIPQLIKKYLIWVMIQQAWDKPLYSGRAPRCSKYFCAFPSIQIVKENLKFGYEIAQVLLKIPSMASCAHEPSWKDVMRGTQSGTKPQTGSWRDITNSTAFAIGSVCGYFAYMRAIAAQDVWTTWVLSCSTHTQASHVCRQN